MATRKFPEISPPPPRNNPLFLQICSLIRFSWYLYQVAKTTTPCPGGGIGRRAGFRCQCSIRTCGFKSRPGHTVKSRDIVLVGVSRPLFLWCTKVFKTFGSLWLNFPIHGSSAPDGICPGGLLSGAECKDFMQALRAPKLCERPF